MLCAAPVRIAQKYSVAANVIQVAKQLEVQAPMSMCLAPQSRSEIRELALRMW